MNKRKFKGVYSALFSIYDKNMDVKRESVEALMDFNLRNGIQGFYVCGNTGECTILPNKTRIQMLETVKGHASEGTKIIAHIGAGHFEDTKELLAHSNAVGVDAVSSLPPSLTTYYSPEETIDYYKYIAAHSNSPVLAYVHPTTLKCDVMWFVNRLMEIDNVIGIKLTVPDYYVFEKIRSQYGEGINILNGPDECMISGLLVGADGAIGSSYNLMPATACRIYDCFTKGDFIKAREYQQKLNRVIDVLLGSNLALWKIPLTVMGIDIGYTAEPARMPKQSEADEILKRLEQTEFVHEAQL